MSYQPLSLVASIYGWYLCISIFLLFFGKTRVLSYTFPWVTWLHMYMYKSIYDYSLGKLEFWATILRVTWQHIWLISLYFYKYDYSLGKLVFWATFPWVTWLRIWLIFMHNSKYDYSLGKLVFWATFPWVTWQHIWLISLLLWLSKEQLSSLIKMHSRHKTK